MDSKEMRNCAFRVIAYENRIAVEFFHSLTDGTGALVFLKSLTAEYLEQKYRIRIPFEHGVLDRREAVQDEELEDSFLRFAGKVPASRKDTNAWKLQAAPQAGNFLNLTCFQLSVSQVLALAHQHNVTITAFLTAVMLQALQDLQSETVKSMCKRKPLKVLIPVNLRKLFPSKTLRNFAMYTIPELDPRLGQYSFDEICSIVKHKMGTDITAKHMRCLIATNVNDEKNPLVRLIPLPLKNLVMKAVFDTVGERKSCLTLSNLGQIQLPDVMRPYIRRFDFILGVQAAAPYNCGVVSYGDTIYINFIRNIFPAALERHFYLVLREMGIAVTVESNRKGGR